ncbi:MAG: hypothetical protein JKY99_06115 [Rhizobiales bacterium]|nr:hypothetical protein [Hyphomicrobiales bacterium]
MKSLIKSPLARAILAVATVAATTLPASALEFRGDSRFDGIEAYRTDPQYYASKQDDGRWLCEIQISYEWDRDMTQPNIVKSIDGYSREDWTVPGNQGQRITMQFLGARGERTRNMYSINLFLESWGPFQTGHTYSLAPSGEPATSNIDVTITSADLMSYDDFNQHCAN